MNNYRMVSLLVIKGTIRTIAKARWGFQREIFLKKFRSQSWNRCYSRCCIFACLWTNWMRMNNSYVCQKNTNLNASMSNIKLDIFCVAGNFPQVLDNILWFCVDMELCWIGPCHVHEWRVNLLAWGVVRAIVTHGDSLCSFCGQVCLRIRR